MKATTPYDRRSFLGASALTLLAAALNPLQGLAATGKRSSTTSNNNRLPAPSPTFKDIKQVKAGVLDIGYAEVGPANGQPVILLHGWPYTIHAFAASAQQLASQGYRVLVPHLRGHGTTRFLSAQTPRNGQQGAIAADVIAFMDALNIKTAVVGGFDWGARTACIVAAVWPERCKALVSVSGYLIGNQQANKAPLPPAAELSWWYQFYFTTERGQQGYQQHTADFAKLIWQTASPSWKFDDATFTASAKELEANPDHVAIVIHNYRWRLGLADGEHQYDALEQKLATFPVITVPSVTLEGDNNGAPHPAPEAYAGKFTGKYVHHTLTGGVGHNLPQEAPEAFAAAIVEAARMA